MTPRALAGLLGAVLLSATPSLLAAQIDSPGRNSGRAPVLERRFPSDSSDTSAVFLEERTVYWAELTGPGTPVIESVRRRGQPALVLLIDEGAADRPRRFEVHARAAGLHTLRVSDVPDGTSVTLRIYRDVTETARINRHIDASFAFGLLVDGGIHSGYRLDPTGGADPRGGADVEGCLLLQAGERWGTCLGAGRQSFPDASYDVTWLFVEERVRLGGGHWLGNRLTDVGATLRYAEGLSAGPRSLNPGLIAIGMYVAVQLANDEHRGGWSLFAAWQHGRLGATPETERLDSNRLLTGLTWLPR